MVGGRESACRVCLGTARSSVHAKGGEVGGIHQGQSLGGPGRQAKESDGSHGRVLNRGEACSELRFRQINLAVAK